MSHKIISYLVLAYIVVMLPMLSCSDERDVAPNVTHAAETDFNIIEVGEDPAYQGQEAEGGRTQASTMKVKRVAVYLNRDEYAEGKVAMKITKTSDGSTVAQSGAFNVSNLLVHSETRMRYTILYFNLDKTFDLGVEYKIEMYCRDCSDDMRKKVNWWYSDNFYHEGVMYSLNERKQSDKDLAFKVEAVTPEGLSYLCALNSEKEDVYHFNYDDAKIGQTFKVGEVINFADSDLQMAAQFALGITYDQPVVTSAVLTLDKLRADYTFIDALGGIEYFKNLTWLDLKINNVVDISLLQNLTKLTYLDLQNNLIVRTDALRSLSSLTELYLNSNVIESCAPLEGLTNLRKLDLAGNRIRNIEPLKNLTRLTYLNLSNNPVSASDIRELEQTLGIDVIF